MAKKKKTELPSVEAKKTNGAPVVVDKVEPIVEHCAEVTITLPIKTTDSGNYLDTTHRLVNARLKPGLQRDGMKYFVRGMMESEATLVDGKKVSDRTSAVQYLFEQIALSVQNTQEK